MDFIKYLDLSVSLILADDSFKNIEVKLFQLEDGGETYYTLKEFGITLLADGDNLLSCIFLDSRANGGFDDSKIEYSFSMTREQVRGCFNFPPSENSDGWDLFRFDHYSIHFEYRDDIDAVDKITLMRDKSVPSESKDEGELLIVPIPSLIATLKEREREKGEALTEEEVIKVRDNCPAIAMYLEQLRRIEEVRGYIDIDPEKVWEEWKRVKGE